MRKMISGLLIAMLILQGLMIIPVGAAGDTPREYSALGKGNAAFVADEIVVKFKDDSKPFRVLKVPEGRVKDKVQEYAARPDVVYAEPNYYAQALMVPNDPLYQPYQWNLGGPETGGIAMEQAWEVSSGSPGVIVAIVDTGIAYENYGNYMKAPDLANTAFVPGYDFINNDAHANDDNSHGTHVAGTVAQSTDNGLGVAGIAYQTTLMPVKVLGKNGSGSYSAIANGIRYAADHGAQVINMSLGGAVGSTTLRDALAYAYGKGVTIVAAAGNDGTGSISYPAAYDAYVIAVGATRYDKMRAAYSNYGTSLDVMAPGGDTSVDQNGDGYGDGILQNTFNPNSKNPSDFSYWFFQGTSMATPHVAGTAALLIAHGNAVTPDTVRAALQETALDLGSAGRDNTYGWGLINAAAALQWGGIPDTAPVADAQAVAAVEDTAAPVTLTATDAENDLLSYTVVTGPTHGSLSGAAPYLSYTPALNYNGADSFTFKAFDGMLYSEPAVVSITVAPANDAPTADAQAVETLVDTAVDITLTGSDVDGDPLTYSVTAIPAHGSLSGTAPSLSYMPAGGYIGEDSVTFIVNDGVADSAPATVVIAVTEPQTPVAAVLTIDMSASSRTSGKNTFIWASAKVTVVENGAPLVGATVEGHWTGAAADADIGVTAGDGSVTLLSNQIKKAKNVSSYGFTFTVDSVTKDGVVYELSGELLDTVIYP